ncbi:SDR family oxidoreductase [Glaciimonas sp. CA11.2]|uniref:SDR family NAD(P)-dependent oxidoreductase n=1 Tax=unclassified Glaciimonas TaxID=2644401 RepID=UPI002AB4814F|nr:MULTISPECIES: SDR family oxidoreductase [unclassified Glaciimonas]MDY7546518.1 SDR family oxidoreductase [Glaciimonas sp. CA11.2]MEB0012908.1 SDR family oxidoreductase [Glaciimonas sp. Cout2]MEB0080800.1 SDR family oxidoreductase [Glaciimonas sp. Gout2]MEB0162970.1 SDR family oxidoreductase [Glaciimonas sp. CA11.2]
MNTHAPSRVAVVTGGARGIGRAIGEWFLRHDYKVVLLDRENAILDQTVAVIDRPDDVLAVYCDVSDPAQVDRAAGEVIARFGQVDALVNNAGVAIFKPTLEMSFDEWRAIMATNLDGVFLCSQAFGTLMVNNGGGAIVNIASISGLRASTLRMAYGTSKAALIHMTKQYAVEFGSVGVRVNAVAPGPVETEMAKLVHSAAIRSDYYDAIPLGRYATTEEMANVVGFLCSDEASYVNGQVVAVDGGFDATGVGLPTLRRQKAGAGQTKE